MNTDFIESLQVMANNARQKLIESEQFEKFASDLIAAAEKAARHGENSVKITIPVDLRTLNSWQMFDNLKVRLNIDSSRRNIFRFEALSPNTLIFDWA